MLMDSTLLATKIKADRGDADAIIKLGSAFFHGLGVPRDFLQAKKYLIMLADRDPDDLPQLGFGTLLYFIGEACYQNGQMKEANEWFQKSMDYFWETYNDDFAAELTNEYDLEWMLKETASYASF